MWSNRTAQRSIVIIVLLLLFVLVGFKLAAPGSSAQLGQRSLQLSSGDAGVTANQQLSFTYASPGPIGSVRIQYCSNNPFPGEPCVAPAGMDAGSAALVNQTGVTGYSISSSSTANQIILTRPVSATGITASTYEFEEIMNPSSPGSYYVRVYTYATSNASGPNADYGAIVFAITNSLSITATVPPYLLFCTGITIPNFNCAGAQGDYIDFGELSTTSAARGTSEMQVATNAANGYSISMDGTTLTSGSNEITALALSDVSRPSTAQFGLNLRANSTPSAGSDPIGPGVGTAQPGYNTSNFFKFLSGDVIISTTVPDDVREYKSTYVANIPLTQPAGVYVSTITYVCLANF